MVRKALALLVVVAVVGVTVGVLGLFRSGLVDASGHSATRSFSAASVPAAGMLEVTIEASDYGFGGSLVESLPPGFSYESSSLLDSAVDQEGQDVTFILLGDDIFTYIVTASSMEGSYTFSGVLFDDNRNSQTVTGATEVTVEAAAATQTASRSFSAISVAPGDELTVTIEAMSYGASGEVVETLPTGFSYVEGSSDLVASAVGVSGQDVTFTLAGEASFTYKVTASDTVDDYTFSGVLKNENDVSVEVVGDSSVSVEAVAATHTASRSFSAMSVPPGADVVVTITATGYGSLGQVEETLPAGFSYVDGSSSLAASAIVVVDQVVKFRLLGEDLSVTYTVMAASTPGTHDFSGIISNEDREEARVTGDSRITVEATETPAPSHSATRSFSVTSVPANGEFAVTITATGYGSLGQVEETLPAGFSYVDGSSSLAASAIVVVDQVVKFRLLGEDLSVTYTVMAASTPGTHDFSGIIRNEDREEARVTGDSRIMVEATETPAPSHSATRSFSVTSVPANGEFAVTITATGYGSLGQVEETLPAGFSYVDGSSSLAASAVVVLDQVVKFRLLGDASFTYMVTASSTPNTYDFSGIIRNADQESARVVGPTRMTVESHKATRSFSDASVDPGDRLIVTITAAGYGSLGQVEETLPAGFSYVDGSSSLAASAVVVLDQVVKFRLLGDASFTYTVTAANTMAHHNFVGVLRDEDRNDTPVGGASSVTVGTPATPPRPSGGGGSGGGIRALPAGTVAAGVTVMSPAPSEMVPAQASVRTPNAGVVLITIAPEHATPLLQGLNVAGTVFDIIAPRASVEEPLVLTFLVRTQTASGDLIVLKDGVTVGDCRGASGQASPDPCVSSRGKAGTTVVVKVLTSEASIWEFRSPKQAAPTPTPTVRPTARPTPVPTARPTPVPTARPTPVPTARPTPVPTVPPTPVPTVPATPVPTVTPTPTPTPTVDATPTPVPTVPATTAPMAAPMVPPTPAPTATPTTAPVAVTVAPEPSPTAMPEPTVTTTPVAPPGVEEDEGFPLWLIVVIIVGVGAVLVGGGLIILRARGG